MTKENTVRWFRRAETALWLIGVTLLGGAIATTVRSRFYQARQGRAFSLMVSAARFTLEGRDYLVLNGRDVTAVERERLEREAILLNASIGIAMTRDRRFHLANPKFEQMFGWSPGSLGAGATSESGTPSSGTSAPRWSFQYCTMR